MAEVTRIVKTPPVPAKIDYVAVRLTPKEIEYLRTGLEYAYKAGNPYSYAAKPIKDLYAALGHAQLGKTTEQANAAKPMTLNDLVSTRTF